MIEKITQVKTNFTNNNFLKKNSFKDILTNISNNHKNLSNIVESSLNNNNLSPENLIKIQYQTGLFFLKEQTFCKTAEISAGSLKSFTQMQI